MSEANNPASAEAEAQELAPEVNADGADQSTEDTGQEADTSEAGEAEGSEDGESDSEADGHEEIELDGEKYLVPPALKKALTDNGLRQDDYTRKTQAVAEERKALETARQDWEQKRAQQSEAVTKLRDEIVKVGSLESQLAAYKDVDWRAAQNQIAALTDPQQKAAAVAELNLAWSQFQQLEREHTQAKQALTEKEQELASAQTQAVQAAVRDALQSIQKEDPTFNVERAQAAVKHAMDNFGLTEGEAHQLSDKRIWKLMLSDKSKTDEIAQLKAENAKLKGQRSAVAANTAAQQARPAVRVGAPKAPPAGLSDKDPMDVWLKKRNAELAKKRA